jgi:drug/metabolite transporter (DMT)-like permease
MNMPASTTRAPLSWIITAFAMIYIVWGSTFLCVHYAIATIPPLLMAGARFILAGALLYAFVRLRGTPRPDPLHWKSATIAGALLLLGGNAGMNYAQLTVSTGVAALIVAAVPLWMLLIDWLRPRGTRPSFFTVLGLAMGFCGVGLMVSGRNANGNLAVDPWGATILLLGTLSWAIGSVYVRHASRPQSILLSIAMQMLAGGVMQLVLGIAIGELGSFSPGKVTAISLAAFFYLSIMGSLVAFTCFAWLMQVCSPTRVSTYAYVNPLIAVVLGHWVLGETLPQAGLLGGGLIVGAVLLLNGRSA